MDVVVIVVISYYVGTKEKVKFELPRMDFSSVQ